MVHFPGAATARTPSIRLLFLLRLPLVFTLRFFWCHLVMSGAGVCFSRMWACPACTLENEASLTLCDACGGNKPVILAGKMDGIPEADDENTEDHFQAIGGGAISPTSASQVVKSGLDSTSPDATAVAGTDAVSSSGGDGAQGGPAAPKDTLTEDDFQAVLIHLDSVRESWQQATQFRYVVCSALSCVCIPRAPIVLVTLPVFGRTQELHVACQQLVVWKDKPECLKFASDLLFPIFKVLMDQVNAVDVTLQILIQALFSAAEFAHYQLCQGRPSCVRSIVFLLDPSHLFFMSYNGVRPRPSPMLL